MMTITGVSCILILFGVFFRDHIWLRDRADTFVNGENAIESRIYESVDGNLWVSVHRAGGESFHFIINPSRDNISYVNRDEFIETPALAFTYSYPVQDSPAGKLGQSPVPIQRSGSVLELTPYADKTVTINLASPEP